MTRQPFFVVAEKTRLLTAALTPAEPIHFLRSTFIRTL